MKKSKSVCVGGSAVLALVSVLIVPSICGGGILLRYWSLPLPLSQVSGWVLWGAGVALLVILVLQLGPRYRWFFSKCYGPRVP